MLKILFMGTPDFSLSALEAVYNSGNELIAVVTQPDKPKGRGKQTTPPPVKEWVLQRNIEVPVFQPQKIRGDVQFMEETRQLAPDLVVTAAFGQILPKVFLDIPRLGCINVHASLLPEYRGASPIQQVLIDGREKTGISIQYMDVGMDTGDVILQEEVPIEKDENAGQLFDRLAALGGSALSKVLKLFKDGKPAGVPQDHDKATYCSKIDKSMGEIQWDKKASEIRNLIRGLTPWPGTYTFLNGERIKVWKAREWEYFTNEETGQDGTDASAAFSRMPGTVLKADKHNGLVVACGEGALRILELQGPGGRPMPDLDYLRGNPVEPGTVLGQPQGR